MATKGAKVTRKLTKLCAFCAFCGWIINDRFAEGSAVMTCRQIEKKNLELRKDAKGRERGKFHHEIFRELLRSIRSKWNYRVWQLLKSEIRISKSETNQNVPNPKSKIQNPNRRPAARSCPGSWFPDSRFSPLRSFRRRRRWGR